MLRFPRSRGHARPGQGAGGCLAAYTPIYEQIAKGARGYAADAGLLTVDELKRVAGAWE